MSAAVVALALVGRATEFGDGYSGDIPARSRSRGQLGPGIESEDDPSFAIRDNDRVALRRMDNVGIVVESLDAAISFSSSWVSSSRGER